MPTRYNTFYNTFNPPDSSLDWELGIKLPISLSLISPWNHWTFLDAVRMKLLMSESMQKPILEIYWEGKDMCQFRSWIKCLVFFCFSVQIQVCSLKQSHYEWHHWLQITDWGIRHVIIMINVTNCWHYHDPQFTAVDYFIKWEVVTVNRLTSLYRTQSPIPPISLTAHVQRAILTGILLKTQCVRVYVKESFSLYIVLCWYTVIHLRDPSVGYPCNVLLERAPHHAALEAVAWRP